VVESQENTTTSATFTLPRALIVLALLAAVGVVVYAVARPAPSTGSPKHLPAFRLDRLGGGSMASSELKGHPVVVNFFASWCKPCKQETGLLQDAYDSTRSQGVRFLGVAVDQKGDTARFVKEQGITYPVVFDSDAHFAAKMRVFGLPETFFVGPDGTYEDAVRGHRIGTSKGTVVLGPLSEKRLEEGLHGLMSQKATS
jgi:peroxiredoxin